MTNVIKVNNLSKKYHTLTEEIEALRNIDLEVYRGEFISIIGPSGCGKSTLLSILGGIDYKSDGIISKSDNLKIGYMFQSDSLFEWLSVLDNCLLGLKIENALNDDSKSRVIELLDKYGLGEFIDYYPSQLSGGMRQRTV